MDRKIFVPLEGNEPAEANYLQKKEIENIGIIFNSIEKLNANVKLMHFEIRGDKRGSLIAIEGNNNIPFDIKRVYYIFDTKTNVIRGKHAHKHLKQILICTSGSCKVSTEDANGKRVEELNDPSVGLYIENLVWREMYDFSADCVLMVLASEYYNEDDYIRNYDDFLRAARTGTDVFDYFKHPLAVVDTNNIGNGTKVWEFTHILEKAKIGTNCNICSHCFIENDVVVGNNVTVKCGVYLWDGVKIEDNVFIGANVTFINDLFPRSKKYPDKFQPTLVKEGASIGANSTIMSGLTIGKYSLIGAGSVVTKSISDHSLWYGHPAKFKGYICSCGEKLTKSLICSKCTKAYKKSEDRLKPVQPDKVKEDGK